MGEEEVEDGHGDGGGEEAEGAFEADGELQMEREQI